MTQGKGDLHVYLRSMAQGERTSLSVLAGMVTPGSRVLDLGTGSGALGEHLRAHAACTVDGVTINEREAELARPHYRRVEVANLEDPGWTSAFSGEQFDFIVCADVLEHLRDPHRVLHASRELLAPGGRMLISVPNAAYCGLVAELLQGDFTYRNEGLLDRTHLRFFTRRSLVQFLAAEGWAVDSIEPIERPLNESEFKLAFDQLPPAVARYLLAVPDAAAYQFVVASHPSDGAGDAAPVGEVSALAVAYFSAELYVGADNTFAEDKKIVATGVIGQERQVLRFALPASSAAPTGLRLDPADRPGFLHLHRITLRADSGILWQWQGDIDGLGALRDADHQDMVLHSHWLTRSPLVLLHGDDPRIVLPVPAEALRACAAPAQAVLEVELGWPMSADYLALAETVEPLHQQMREARRAADREIEQNRRKTAEANAQVDQIRAQMERARQAEMDALAEVESLRARERELGSQLRMANEQNSRIVEEKNLLAQQKLSLQANLTHLAQLYEALGNHLRWIENSTVFRMTRPLVNAKMALERMTGKRSPETRDAAVPNRPLEPTVDTVDVIVPVYRGLEDTQLCVGSVLSSRCSTKWRLIILNDASPEPEVTEWLREVSHQDNRIVLLENEENLGFVATVNRGMTYSDRHDVILLNSDTEVANDWLDRLRRAAYSDARVATVTPFSNNATICSYPRFCEPNELPHGYDTARLDALFARENQAKVVDIPTGVGFCMYIRRDSLDALGLFDFKNFGKGYGEENDFCRRAADAGWRNLHALDTFVLHTGGVSFGASKSQREIEAVEKMRRLHPSYDRAVHEFVTADPARAARLAVDLARVRSAGLPCVLAVMHNRVGGTLRHAAELAEHLRDKAIFFVLSPTPGSAVALELLEPDAGLRVEFSLPAQWQMLLDVLRSLGIAHLHYHHVLGHCDQVLGLGEQLGLPWDFTTHDYYAMCPQISLTDASDRYCGEEGGGQCDRCLQRTHAPGGLDIASWRERHGRLLTGARHVLAPSRDAARRFARMWPPADVRLAPHTDLANLPCLPEPGVVPIAPNAPLKVVVIGALSRIKGADLLEDVAKLAAKSSAPVEFHLIGYAYRDLLKQPRAALTVHGPYEEGDLPGLLRWIKPDLVWFPALWPETYSYTLSACLAEGLPVVAPDLGAFPERLSGRQWSWIAPWGMTAEHFLAFFHEVREKHFATGQPPVPYRQDGVDPVDARIGSWSYDRDYLHHVTSRQAGTELDAEVLATLGPARQGAEGQRRWLKHWALGALVALRSAPPLRQVARAIPVHWQRRVKTWLRA
jgi:O-antigen biosynthesis protein